MFWTLNPKPLNHQTLKPLNPLGQQGIGPNYKPSMGQKFTAQPARKALEPFWRL